MENRLARLKLLGRTMNYKDVVMQAELDESLGQGRWRGEDSASVFARQTIALGIDGGQEVASIPFTCPAC